MQHYNINFVEQKSHLFVTLSVILKDNNKTSENEKAIKSITDIQRKIISSLDVDKMLITKADSLREALEKNRECIVYQYPEDRLHFSLFDFCKLGKDIDNKDFEKERKDIEGEDFFEGIKTEMERIKMETEKFSTSAKIRRIYIPNKKISDSLALNIYPDQSWFSKLESIREKARGRLQDIKNSAICVKDYGAQGNRNFAINIIRFIDPKKTIENCSEFYREVEKINKVLESNPISFQIETITPVISDPYLSNNNPSLL